MDILIVEYIAQTKEKYPFLSEDCLQLLANRLEVKEYDSKDFFIRENEKDVKLAYIHKGLIRAFFVDDMGNDRTINLIKEGIVVTDHRAFSSKERSKFNFQCLEKSTLFLISKKDVDEICDQFPEFEKYYRICLELYLELFFSRIEGFLFENAEQRYLDFIAKNKDMSERVSVSVLCSYLGMKRQTLTRIRQKIAKSKL